jgi:metallo-beta-lactamase class B
MAKCYTNVFCCALLAVVSLVLDTSARQSANVADTQSSGTRQASGPVANPFANTGPEIEVTVDGHTYGQHAEALHNLGSPEDQVNPMPPHRIVGDLYYVGTVGLASYLVVTPEGDILINTTFERNVPTIRKSVEQLGFKFTDIKIILGSHAHSDHQEGDALAKQLTGGAKVMVMAEDVPLLQKMMPGGKPHPIDRVLHDGDEVELGGATLVAHLTPGHTPGCTTWTIKIQDGGRTYDVVIVGSLSVAPGTKLVNNANDPHIVDEYRRAFKVSKGLRCDIFLASHGAVYDSKEKYAKLRAGGPNPFIDPDGYKREIAIEEAIFNAVLAQQSKAETTR